MIDFILYKKHLLDQEVGLDAFRESVDIRFQNAIKRMGLSSECIDIKCFCSVNKECVMTPTNGKMRIYMDKHQMDLLYGLTLFFYLYGHIDVKYAAYHYVFRIFPYFEKRLSYFLLVMQAEKCFCAKRLALSKAYLDAADAIDYKSYFPKESEADTLENQFLLNLLWNKGEKQDISYCFSLNFFVFHELSHAKYTLAPDDLKRFEEAVGYFLNSTDYQELVYSFGEGLNLHCPDIPIEECICDVYALYLLFDFVYENASDYHFEYMLDSYFVSVLILALVNSKQAYCDLLSEEEYAYAGKRAVYAIAALGIIWMSEGRPLNMQMSLGKSTHYSFDRFKNLKLTLDHSWGRLYSQFHLNEQPSMSIDEERSLAQELIHRFSKIS